MAKTVKKKLIIIILPIFALQQTGISYALRSKAAFLSNLTRSQLGKDCHNHSQELLPLESFEPILDRLDKTYFVSLPMSIRLQLKQAGSKKIRLMLQQRRNFHLKISNLDTWLTIGARHAMLSSLREIMRKESLPLYSERDLRYCPSSVYQAIGPLERALLAEKIVLKGVKVDFQYSILDEAFAQLSKEEALAWRLLRVAGLSLKEAAERIGYSQNVILKTLQRAEEKIRDYLLKKGIEVDPLFAASRQKIKEARLLEVLSLLEENKNEPLTITQIWGTPSCYQGLSWQVAERDIALLATRRMVNKKKEANAYFCRITKLGRKAVQKGKILQLKQFESKEHRIHWTLTKLSQGIQTLPGLLNQAVREGISMSRFPLTEDIRTLKEDGLIKMLGERVRDEPVKWALVQRGRLYLEKFTELLQIEQEIDSQLRKIHLTPKEKLLLEAMEKRQEYTVRQLFLESAYRNIGIRYQFKKLEELGLIVCVGTWKAPGVDRRTTKRFRITERGIDWLKYNQEYHHRRDAVLKLLKDIKNGLYDGRLPASIIEVNPNTNARFDAAA